MKKNKKRLHKSTRFDYLDKIKNWSCSKVDKVFNSNIKSDSNETKYFVPPNCEFVSSTIINNKQW